MRREPDPGFDGLKRRARHLRRQARRDRALARQATAPLPVAARLALLDARLGPGRGATRERARLAAAGPSREKQS